MIRVRRPTARRPAGRYPQLRTIPPGGPRLITDANGNVNHMYAIPKFTMEDLGLAGALGTGVHEAFLRDGVEVDEILIGRYPASADGSGQARSVPGADPWTVINYDESLAACAAMGTGWHLMTVWEWSAVALWCMANGFQPRGNTQWGRAHDATDEHGVRVDGGEPGVANEPTSIGRTYTGSGPDAWNHDASPSGIADLVGNVWEWHWGMKLVDGRAYLAADNDVALTESAWTDTGFDMPSDRTWATIDPAGAAQSLQRALIVPNGSADPQGYYWTNSSGERLPRRGGDWNNGGNAGLAALALNLARGSRHANIGFRPAFAP